MSTRERAEKSRMKEPALKAAGAPKYSTVVLALLFAFAVEVLDGTVTAVGQPAEYRTISALVSVAVLLLLGLAIYGTHHRSKWGAWLAVAIACVTLGFSLPTLLVGNLTINGVHVDQTPLSQAVGWTKMAAYGLFLFLLIRDGFTSTGDSS
jgi:hypothetical protein